MTIMLLGFISYDTITISAGGGTIISMANSETGYIRLPGAVSMGKDNDLTATTGDDCTIFYYIHNDALNA